MPTYHITKDIPVTIAVDAADEDEALELTEDDRVRAYHALQRGLDAEPDFTHEVWAGDWYDDIDIELCTLDDSPEAEVGPSTDQ
jgi:hypothetical protein